jgi:hypothetical protein
VTRLVWSVEWRLALARKRDLPVRVLAPLAVVLVIASGGLPASALPAAYVALFVGFTGFSTAWGVGRDAERGMVRRVVRGGVAPASFLLQRAGAGASLALVQLLPAALLGALFLRATPAELVTALAALAVGVWIAGLVGVVSAAAGRSRAEAIVVTGSVLLMLLHMSGVFATPAADGLGGALERVAPFRTSHEGFVTMLRGGGVGGGAAALVWVVALPAVMALLAPALVRPLKGARR